MSPVARLPAAALLGVTVLAVFVGSLVLTAGPAAARSCAEPNADFADWSDLAFSGVVRDRTSGDDPVVKVRVDRVFKGEVTRHMDVVSDPPNPSYAITAEIEDAVVVFARMEGDEVTSDLCSVVVGPGSQYDRVLRDLGQGAAPSDGYTQADRAGLTYDQWRTWRLVFGVIGLAFMAFFAFRVLRGRLARRRTSDGE